MGGALLCPKTTHPMGICRPHPQHTFWRTSSHLEFDDEGGDWSSFLPGSLCFIRSHHLCRGGPLEPSPLSCLRLANSWAISFTLFWSCITAASRGSLSRECAIKYCTCCPLHNIINHNIPFQRVRRRHYHGDQGSMADNSGRSTSCFKENKISAPDKEVVCFLGDLATSPYAVPPAHRWMQSGLRLHLQRMVLV